MLDSETIAQLERAYTPQGAGQVARHTLFDEIIDRVLCGWDPRSIARYVATVTPEEPLAWTEIEHYAREHIPAALLTAESYLSRNYRFRALQVDEVATLQQLIVAQVQRVSRLMQHEQEAAPDEHGNHAYERAIAKEMEQLRKLLDSSTHLKLALGILKAAPQEINVDQRLMVANVEPTRYRGPAVSRPPALEGLSLREAEKVMHAARFLELVPGNGTLAEGEDADGGG